MKFYTVDKLIEILKYMSDKGYGDSPVVLFIDPDQPYSNKIMQPLLDIRQTTITDKIDLSSQVSIGLFNRTMFDDE